MPFSFVDFLQALTAGILVGSTYALMCIGLGIIFGSMRVINLAQGDFLMVGMYAAFYLTTGFGILTFLGPNAGPIVAALLAGPIVFALGWALHRLIVARVTGAGDARVRADHRHPGPVADPAEWWSHRLRLDADRHPHAIVALVWEIGEILFNQGRCVSFLVAVGSAAAVYLFLNHRRWLSLELSDPPPFGEDLCPKSALASPQNTPLPVRRIGFHRDVAVTKRAIAERGPRLRLVASNLTSPLTGSRWAG